jgi:hypothetical protein
MNATRGREITENLLGKFLVVWDRAKLKWLKADVTGYCTQTNRYSVRYLLDDRVDYVAADAMVGWSICSNAEERDQIYCRRITEGNEARNAQGRTFDNPIISRHSIGVCANPPGDHVVYDIDYTCPFCKRPQVLGESFSSPFPQWEVTGIACPACGEHVYIRMPWKRALVA